MMQTAFAPTFDAKHGLFAPPSSFQYNGQLNYSKLNNINEQKRNENSKQVREIINNINGNFDSVLSLVIEDLKLHKKQTEITQNSLTGIDSSINALCNAIHELQDSIKSINYKINNELNTKEQMKEYFGQQFNSLRLDKSLIHHETMKLIQEALRLNEKSNDFAKTKEEQNRLPLEMQYKVTDFSIKNICINEKNNLELQHHINDVSLKNDIENVKNDKLIVTNKSTSIDESKLDEPVSEPEINSDTELESETDDPHYWMNWFFVYGMPLNQFAETYARHSWDLPAQQIILSIFHLLDLTSLWNCLLVNKVFNTIINYTSLKLKMLTLENTKCNIKKPEKEQSAPPLCYYYPSCDYGNRCRYYHPSSKKEYKQMIKDELCWSYPDCPYGDRCRFKHVSSDEESYEESVT